MMTIQRILHATDFSPTARIAFQYAALLARKLKIPLDVLHVLPGIGPSSLEEVDLSSSEPAANETHGQVLASFREIAPAGIPEEVNIRFLIGRGSLPGPVILEAASHAESNIIVLGAHGRQGSETPFLGSVAADLMQRSTCPVLMVPADMEKRAVAEKIETVLTFVSFSHLIQPVLQFALLLARLFDARLDVLALAEEKARKTDSGAHPETTAKLEQQLWRIVDAQSAASGKSIPADSIRLHLQSTSDADSILAFAREHRSDLLIVEAPGLGPVESPTERILETIVNHSPCPVMLVNTCGKVFGRPSAVTKRMHQINGVM